MPSLCYCNLSEHPLLARLSQGYEMNILNSTKFSDMVVDAVMVEVRGLMWGLPASIAAQRC